MVKTPHTAPEPGPAGRHNALLLLLLVAAALGAGVLWLRAQENAIVDPQRLPEELRDEPDLLVNNAVIHQFRPDGQRRYLLRASLIKHFSNQELTRMERPNLLLESGNTEHLPDSARTTDFDNAPWRAIADFGYVRKRTGPTGLSEEVVFLRENVELSQDQKPPRYLSMRTSSLYVYPDREYVETDESVTIDTHTGRTKAEAMRGNLGEGVLRLSGDTTQVQTIVLPFQFK